MDGAALQVCLREPVPEVFEASRLLDAAVTAHLRADKLAEDHRLMQLVRNHGFDLTVSEMLSILLDKCPKMHFELGDPGLPCGGWLPDLYKEHVCGRPERCGKLRVVE